MKSVLEVNHGKLRQDNLIKPCCVYISFLSFFIVNVNGILLDNIEEIGIGDAHKDLFDFLLRVEVFQTVSSINI